MRTRIIAEWTEIAGSQLRNRPKKQGTDYTKQAETAENTCGRGPKTYEPRGTVLRSVQQGGNLNNRNIAGCNRLCAL